MKVTRRKRLLLVLSCLLAVAIAVTAWNMVYNIDAGQTDYPVRLLEITEDGTSQLTSLKAGLSDFTVVTMSMKRFVALRDDLDGQYDAVYIGKGTYSPATLGNLKDKDATARSKAMDTSKIQNDITHLRAEDISNLFINKGLYVIFHNQTFINQEKAGASKGILYNSFNPLRTLTPQKSNVLFLNDGGLTDFFAGLKTDSSRLKQRPQLQITNSSQIGNYNPASENGKIYAPGDKLRFNFNVSNTANLETHPLTAKLYINLDKSIAMGEPQVVASAKVTQANGTLEYTLPKTYSGLLYWKLEISDPASAQQLKDFERGSIRYRNEQTVVRILQITPADTGTPPESSLKKAVNMKQSYLSNQDYSLDIDVMNMQQFNEYIDTTYKAAHQYGLNGVYDMLLFGFRDEYYSKAILKSRSIEAVKDFINNSHQSVMFTHDTVINLYGDNTWVSNFKDITGQKEPVVNLGHNAVNPSTKVTPVNDGLLMQYPFFLSEQNAAGAQTNILEPKVALTHNQYFTLDLEDRNVVPWYNIISEATKDLRPPDDSWNHYYTYSKGNVTYSGTGHLFGPNSSSGQAIFPDWEQKLFVNTMYRAFMGANHAPKITVYTPDSGTVIPSYQDKITVSYSVADLDLKDRSLTTSLKLKVNGQELTEPDFSIQNRRVSSEETVTQTFNNPLSEDGTIEIVITAQDDQGAAATPVTIPITIKRVDSSLSISRSQSATTIGKNKTVTIDYSIAPKTLQLSDVQSEYQGKESLVISNLRFEETFPANLEFSGEALPAGFVMTGNLHDGYTIKGTFEDITFHLTTVNGVKYFTPVNPNSTMEPLVYTFSLSFKATEPQKYVLDNSIVTFDEIHAPVVPATTIISTDASTPEQTATATPAPNTTFDPSLSTSGTSLGLAGDFNIFALKNIDISLGNLNVDGNVAAGLDVIMGNSSGGVVIKPKGIMVAGQDFYYNSKSSDTGIEINADVTYGRNFFNNVKSLSNLHGEVKKGHPIDFAITESYLKALSTHLNTLPASEVTTVNNLLTFQGTRSDYNVFRVDADNIKPGGMKFIIPKNSIAIINIIGTSSNLTNIWYDFNGTDSNHILYNFPEASQIRTEGTFYGNFLAPWASMRSDSTNITGSIIVDSFSVPGALSGSMNAHLATLTDGALPTPPVAAPVPAPTPTATPVATATPTASPTATPLPAVPVTLKFTKINLEVITEVASITVRDETILLGNTLTLQAIAAILPEDANNQALDWKIIQGNDIISFSSEGEIRGNAAGAAQIQATARDGSNISSNIATITVTSPELPPSPVPSASPLPSATPEPVRSVSITGDTEGKVNTPKTFSGSYSSSTMDTEKNIRYDWKAVDKDGNAAEIIEGNTPNMAIFTGTHSGDYTITLTVFSSSNTIGTSATTKITLSNPLADFTISGGNRVFAGKKIRLSLTNFTPGNPDTYNISWNLTDDGGHYATLSKAKDVPDDTVYELTGNKAKDSITVSVTAGDITRTKEIRIVDLTAMTFSGEVVEINVGQRYNLNNDLWFTPREVTLEDVGGKLQWHSEFKGIASFEEEVTADNRGIITGHKKGSTLVTVTYDNEPDNPANDPIKSMILVKVHPLGNDDRY
ncbi:Bacterial Ig-like domain (group 2) [compost metagenome]